MTYFSAKYNKIGRLANMMSLPILFHRIRTVGFFSLGLDC